MEGQFLSWMEANPYLTGAHYISAMECGLRLIAVCHAFDQVRAWLRRPDLVWTSIVRLVEGHANLIRQRVSLHSSLGNHTIKVRAVSADKHSLEDQDQFNNTHTVSKVVLSGSISITAIILVAAVAIIAFVIIRRKRMKNKAP